MNLDFTHAEYRELLRTLSAAGYRFHTFAEYHAAGRRLGSPHALLRHDVDRLPGRAAALAAIEAAEGVRSTYFFRTRPVSFDAEAIARMRALGHEIGYHYECLPDTRGDLDAAWALFKRELTRFAPYGPVTTIAMHGRPLTRWDGRDLWSRYDYREAGVALEAYLDLDWSRYAYLTDTGRRWDGAYNVRDFPAGAVRDVSIAARGTRELGRRLARHRPDVVLSAHPERWSAGLPAWSQVWVLDSATNAVKLIIQAARRATT